MLAGLAVFHHVLGVKYRFAQIAYDEHHFLFQGWSVLQGQVPYKDFQDFKPPVIFLVNALGLKLFGLEDLGYRNFLSLLSLAGFAAVALALLSRRVHRGLVLGAIALMIEHFYDDGLHNGVINDAESPAVALFTMGVGVLLLRTRWRRSAQLVGGALLSLAPLGKEPLVFPVLVAWVALLLLDRQEAGSKPATRGFILWTVAGAAWVAATWALYMLVTDSFSWYLLQLKLNIAYAENYAYQVGWVKRSSPSGALAEAFRRLREGYVNAPHLATLLPLFVALVTLWRGRRRVGLAAIATFAASLYAVTFGGGYAARYFIMAMTGTFFCATLGTIALDSFVKRRGARARNWVGASLLGVALLATGPRFAHEWSRYETYRPPPLAVSQKDIDFVVANTTPQDKIFTTDDPLLCVFSNRVSAFIGGNVLDEIIEYYPGKTDQQRLSVVREALERNRPKVVVVGGTVMSGPHRKRRYMRALVVPFLREGGYRAVSRNYYLRPD